MAFLKLHPHHLQVIRAHAESTYPDECCGIMLGQIADDGKILVEVWQTENAWNVETSESFHIDAVAKRDSTKRRNYTIAPETLLKAQREARDRDLDIIGIYHSHPDYPAVPSEFDLACAWPQYSYIIVSVQNGKACDLKSWSDNNGELASEEVIIVQTTEIENIS